MAFNVATFKTRALSAVVFAFIMLGGLMWNQWSFLGLFIVIHFGCWIEYHRLMDKIAEPYKLTTPFLRYSVMAFGFAFMLCTTNASAYQIAGISYSLPTIGGWLLLVSLGLLILSGWVARKSLNKQVVLVLVAGFVYISICWALMLKIRDGQYQSFMGFAGWVLPVVLIASIWINDTMAYLTGSFIGRTPLSSISPNKTWEGTIGGVILAMLLVGVVGNWAFGLPFWPLILISVSASIIGTLGDLLESKLKRMAGVKDSGQMMPGHGGFLDRFDSLLLATPFVWILAELFL